MNKNFRYSPLLQWRTGERNALKNMEREGYEFTPIFQLVSDKNFTTQKFFEETLACYDNSFYYDTDIIDNKKRDYMKSLAKFASKNKIKAYPIIRLNDIINNNVQAIIENTNHFGYIVPIKNKIENEINILIPYMQDYKINLILDMGIITTDKIAYDAATHCQEIIKQNYNKLREFKNITFMGCSIPQSLQNIKCGESESYVRFDILIFQSLVRMFRQNPISNLFSYSDYGAVRFSDIEYDFSKIKILPKVRYTTNDKYIVLKGKKDWKNNIMIKSYKDLAKEIVQSQFYYGKDFSFGDKKIYEKATNIKAGVGSNHQWVTYSTNHHIAVLLKQLSHFDEI